MSSLVERPAPAAEHRAALAFRQDESGSIGILFALTSLVVMSLVGGAIDYGRAVHARYQIQEAVDSAVLAAARVWQTENDLTLAQQKGLAHYANNKPPLFDSEVTSFTPDLVNNTISMEATGMVPTPFLSLVRTEGYTVSGYSQAKLEIGKNAGRSVELSLMLDVTGSMAGSKIDDLKAAAKDLVDIVVWDDQSQYTSKIALVPFADAVNVGSAPLANSVRGNIKTGSCLTSSSPCTNFLSGLIASLLGWVWGEPANWYRFTRSSGSNTHTYKVSSYCVSERTGANAYTDAAPTGQLDRLGPAYLGSSNSGDNCGMVNTNDAEVNSVHPLSSDKVMLKRRIDKLSVGGGTAGHLGTAWAWYMLSPNWAYLWSSANRPQAYGADKLDKIAVLMTDGEYNTMYCNGAKAKNSQSAAINCNATNGQSTTQARTLCTNMKAKGIVVYTVGFQLGGNQSAIDTLAQCASSADKFFNAEDGVELRNSFRAIALQISKLRLAQ